MPRVFELDEMVPEDIVFRYRGADYLIPGDLDTELVLRLYRMFGDLLAEPTSGDEAEDESNAERIVLKVKEELLAIFQVLQPGMEKLPFGALGIRAVIRCILIALGVIAESPQPASPVKKTPARSRSSKSRRK